MVMYGRYVWYLKPELALYVYYSSLITSSAYVKISVNIIRYKR